MVKTLKLNSIRIKSSISTVVLAVLVIALLGVGYWALKIQERSIKLQSEIFMQSVSLTLNADRDLYQARVAELNLLARHGSTKKENASRLENAQQVADRYAKYQQYMKNYPDVLAQSASFDTNFHAWKKLSDKIVSAIDQEDFNKIKELRKEVDYRFSVLRRDLDKAGEAALSKSVEVRAKLENKLYQFEEIALLIISITLLGALWLGYVIPKNIARQLQKTIDTAEALSVGDFSNMIDIDSTDETGQLLNSMERLQHSIQSLMGDMNYMSKQHNMGDIDVVVDESKFQGDFRRMAAGINSMVDGHIRVKKAAMAVFKSFGNGDFSAEMEKLPGKKVFINETIEMVRNNLTAISDDTHLLIQAVANGELDKRANTNQFQGDWKQMIEGINQIIDGIVLPVNEAISVLREVEQGNLTKIVTGQYKGQLDDFKQTVNNMVAKLSAVINQTVQASQIVSQGSQEVAQGALDLSQRVQEQAASIEETSATMEEMTSSVRNNAKHAQEASSVAQAVQEQSNTGSAVMKQTIEAMSAIQESSHKISDIVTMIDGIAFQTNLLALNAAVEAARAGEHGRGFAVVAGEVRSLAGKSAEAAKEITGLISESVARIDQGTQLASDSNEVLTGINQSIDEVAKMIEQIAQASNQQMEGIDQVHKAVSQIDEATQHNAALVEQTAASADSMSEQAEHLDNNMAFFNTKKQTDVTSTPASEQISLSPPMETRQYVKSSAFSNRTTPSSDEWDEF